MPLQDANQIVAHIPDENLNLICYEVCSLYVLNAVFDKRGNDVESVLISAIQRLASSSLAAGLVGQMFELYLLRYFLPKGGSVTIARFDQGEQTILLSS